MSSYRVFYLLLSCFGGGCTFAVLLFDGVVVFFCKVGVALPARTEVGRVVLLKGVAIIL